MMTVSWTKLKISTDFDQYFHFQLSEILKHKKKTRKKAEKIEVQKDKKAKRQTNKGI